MSRRFELAAGWAAEVDRLPNAVAGNRRGLTVVELLVVLFIIALLLGLAFVALQGAREAGRRSGCSSNLRQLGMAISAYEVARGVFPAGMESHGFSLHVSLLPYLEQNALYAKVDFSRSAEYENDLVRRFAIDVFVCPSDGASAAPLRSDPRNALSGAATHYAGNFGTGVLGSGYNGLFHHVEKPPRLEEPALAAGAITDGLSNTAAMSEILAFDGSSDFLRTNWRPSKTANDADEFAAACGSMSPRDLQGASDRTSIHRGRPWTWGEVGCTLYNHVLPPNRASCLNGGRVQEGAYTAASRHPHGVDLLFADGRVTFVLDSISPTIWRAYGSRNGKDRVE